MNTTKQCTICKKIKDISAFHKRKNRKCKTVSACKKCSKTLIVTWKKSRLGVIAIIYNSQRDNSKKRNHPLPAYTKKELSDWLLNDWLFNLLYDNWANCGFQKSMKPSIDRENDFLSYSFHHQLFIITWGENRTKGHSDRAKGAGTQGSLCKKIYQLSRDGEIVSKHHSQAEASRETGVRQSDISACCRNKRKTAGGFMWAFV